MLVSNPISIYDIFVLFCNKLEIMVDYSCQLLEDGDYSASSLNHS